MSETGSVTSTKSLDRDPCLGLTDCHSRPIVKYHCKGLLLFRLLGNRQLLSHRLETAFMPDFPFYRNKLCQKEQDIIKPLEVLMRLSEKALVYDFRHATVYQIATKCLFQLKLKNEAEWQDCRRDMSQPRMNRSAVIINDHLYVSGGVDPNKQLVTDFARISLEMTSLSWELLPEMPRARAGHYSFEVDLHLDGRWQTCLVLINDFLVGSWKDKSGERGAVDVFPLESSRWLVDAVPRMPEFDGNLVNSLVTVHSNRIFVFFQQELRMLDPLLLCWKSVTLNYMPVNHLHFDFFSMNADQFQLILPHPPTLLQDSAKTSTKTNRDGVLEAAWLLNPQTLLCCSVQENSIQQCSIADLKSFFFIDSSPPDYSAL